MPRTQVHRTLAIHTPLGEDVVLLRSLRGEERLGGLFRYNLHLLSEHAIAQSDILGQDALLRLGLEDGPTRLIHGMIAGFARDSGDAGRGRLARYRAILVPHLWLLTRTTDSRIFQDKSVPDIVREVLADHGLTDVELRLSNTYEPRSYCVQYQETDFRFISRLLEDEGIAFYFEPRPDGQTLVLCDSQGAYEPRPGLEELTLHPGSGSWHARLHEFTLRSCVVPGRFTARDFEFKAPSRRLDAASVAPQEHANAGMEIFEYPGGYSRVASGERLARLRMEEHRAGHELAHATGHLIGPGAGRCFRLAAHPDPDLRKDYLITREFLSASNDAFESLDGATGGPVFSTTFHAIDARTVFRPRRRTPKPRILSVQTAIVVGPEGEELWTDQHGRVQVHFHWDRHQPFREGVSCWIRVSQAWAGNGYGAMFLPRIGHEVVVAFLEGDPHRPLIVGRVYNGDHATPHPLPGSATVSTLKSSSSKGGDGFNELRFDDTKGSELLSIQAEKDRQVLVKNDNQETVARHESVGIGANRTKSVGGDESTSIGGHRTESVGAAESVSIGASRTLTVAASNQETIGAGETRLVAAGQSETIGGNQSLTIAASQDVAVGANQSVTVGAMQTSAAGLLRSASAGLVGSSSAGLIESVSAGLVVSVVAGLMVRLQGPGGSISITPDGIEIKGKKILIQGDRVDLNP